MCINIYSSSFSFPREKKVCSLRPFMLTRPLIIDEVIRKRYVAGVGKYSNTCLTKREKKLNDFYSPRKGTRLLQKLLSFLFFLCAFSVNLFSSEEKVPSGTFSSNKENIIKRIAQCTFPPRTISVEYIVEESGDGGKNWKCRGIVNLYVDQNKNSASIEYKHAKNGKVTINRKMYFEDEKLTTISTLEWEEKTKNGTVIPVMSSTARIRKCNKWLLDDNDVAIITLAQDLLFFDSHWKNVPLFSKNVLIFPSPKISLIQYENKSAIKIESHTEKIASKLKTTFIFDSRNGFLLEKQESSFNKNLIEEMGKVIIPSKYQLYNGRPFPNILTISFPKSENCMYMSRIVISDIKINEPINRRNFVAVLPLNTKVRNEITKQNYVTPALGNIGLESEIEKNLKELFNEAKK